MRTNTMLSFLIAGAALVGASSLARAQAPETKDSLEKKLKDHYSLTKLSADHKDVVTPGGVFTLKVDNLVLTPVDSSDVSGNTYRVGKITQSGIGRTNEKANKVKGLFGRLPIGGSAPAAAPTNATRTFVAGEKVNITKIEWKDGSVAFEVCSTKAYTDQNTYYRGTLTFPVEKGNVPAADAMLATTGEVFSVDPPEDAKAAPAAGTAAAADSAAPQAAPAQPPAQATTPDTPPVKYEEIAPPPPPPAASAPAPKLELGMTTDQVIQQLGQPVTTAVAGDKQIYLFKDWKVTFQKGKVTDIDAR